MSINKTADFIPIESNSIPFHIAMLHGSLQTNTTHDVYAPFKLADFDQYDFDYWALGHIHKREILKKDPFVVYPGNIQGRHIKETGEKGCYEVTLTESGIDTQFRRLASIEFVELSIDTSDCKSVFELEQLIYSQIKEMNQRKYLMRLELISNQATLKDWEQNGLIEDMIDIINGSLLEKMNWIHIYSFHTKVEKFIDEATLKKGNHFQGELLRMIEESEVIPNVTELYQHKRARKFIQSLTETDELEIKTEAKQLLMSALLLED